MTIGIPPGVFRTVVKRSATPKERARINPARWFSHDIINPDQITRFCKDRISLTGSCIDKSSNAKVTNADLWKLFMCASDDLTNFDNALVTIEGRDRTVVIARGFANATVIA